MKRRWTLCEWLEEWFEVYKKPNLSANSLRNIGQVLRLYIPDELERAEIERIISAHDVEKLLAAIPYPRSRVYARQVLFSAFDKAFKLDFVSRNIMLAVERVRYRKQHGKSLTMEEQRFFMERLETSRYKWLMLFYMLTGVRRTERLHWNGRT